MPGYLYGNIFLISAHYPVKTICLCIYGVIFFVGITSLGLKRTAVFTSFAYVIAFVSEYSSTRISIPYGYYHYTGVTQGKELYIFNVPFMDSISYSFLAYFSYSLALLMLSPVTGNGWRYELPNTPWHSKGVLFLSAVLFMLQDVLIDPAALRGSRWFLGQIYYYPNGGIYFGVPLSNFLGWFLVGLTIIYSFQKLDQKMAWPTPPARNVLAGPLCYFINMVFILFIIFYIGEFLIGLVSLAIFGVLFCSFLLKIRQTLPVKTRQKY